MLRFHVNSKKVWEENWIASQILPCWVWISLNIHNGNQWQAAIYIMYILYTNLYSWCSLQPTQIAQYLVRSNPDVCWREISPCPCPCFARWDPHVEKNPLAETVLVILLNWSKLPVVKNPVDVHLGKILHVAGSIPVLAFASSQSVSKPRTHSVAWVSMTLVEAWIWMSSLD